MFAVGTIALFLFFAAFFWGNVVRVEYDYALGHVQVADGVIKEYRASDDGKFVSFVVSGTKFNVSCCTPDPVYRGTPIGNLVPGLLGDGMRVKITYLRTGEIVRILTDRI